MASWLRNVAMDGRHISLPGFLIAVLAIASPLAAVPASAADPIHNAASGPPYVLTGAISPLGGDVITSFDISFVDPVLNRYFVANRTGKSVIVVDTTTNKAVAQFKPGFAGFSGNNDTSGPDGLVVVDHKELWVGDFPSRVWVLDVNTGAPVVPPISTGGKNRADEMCYDPVDKIVAVVNNADSPPFITFISTTTRTVLGSVNFDGTNGAPTATNGAEQCQWNHRDGKIYLSIPEINGAGDNSSPGGVVVFEPTTRAILRTMIIPSASCTGPQGLAIGPGNQIGLGCNVGPTGANTAIIDERDGTVLGSFPGLGGADMIWYNPGNNKYYIAARQNPAGESLIIIDAGLGFAVQQPSTSKGSNAHSVAVESIFNQAYVPISSAATGHFCSSMGGVDSQGCIAIFSPAAAPNSIVAAVAPTARTTTVNRQVTGFASIINGGPGTATACSISLPLGFPANFLYQTTNQANAPTGVQNAPANIPPGGSQTFVFAVTPTAMPSTDIPMTFTCTNSNPAPTYFGVNTFLLSVTGAATPDMISIADTATHDGNIVFPPPGQGSATQVMVVAAVNVGAAGTVTFTPTDTPFGQPPRGLPLTLSICQTDATGTCMGASGPSVTLPVAPNQMVTFTVSATRLATSIPYVPSFNRVFLHATQAGTPVGQASAAVKEQ
ncbi:MAG: hypothetical protein C5B48_05810 [Candidatus Rokuibacteriota bacterium]|nr:MAG: hypothetical protein C5B48_05810 [Candidatus Rokubacteria bacterium]